jgi:hypothetical protein
MTPERERTIRDHWPVARAYGFDNGPRVKVPVRQRVSPPKNIDEFAAKVPAVETLEYELQRGFKGAAPHRTPWVRVVCEGIVVAEGSMYV